MKLSREFEVAAPPAQVWGYFQDVPSVTACLPGAELAEVKEDGSHAGAVTFKLGPITAVFEGAATINVDTENRVAHISGKGRDRTGGSQGRIELDYRVDASDGGSRVGIEADITLSGAAAQIGRPGLINEMTTRMIDDFVVCIEARLAAPDFEAASSIKAAEVKGVRLVLMSIWSAIVASVKRRFGRSRPPGSDADEGVSL